MIKKMKKITFILLSVLFCTSMYCGELVYNKQGKRVLLKGDGKWEYFDEMALVEAKIIDKDLVGKYKGEVNKEGYANGYGTAEGVDIYEGNFKNGELHGYGKYIWRQTEFQGDIYEGEFQNGNMHGKGKIVFANGNAYIGDWNDSAMDGNGEFYFINGTIYQGEFKNNFFDGNGRIISKNGAIYEDQFTEGVPQNILKYKDFLKQSVSLNFEKENQLDKILYNIEDNLMRLEENNEKLIFNYKLLTYQKKIDLKDAQRKILILELSNQFMDELIKLYKNYHEIEKN